MTINENTELSNENKKTDTLSVKKTTLSMNKIAKPSPVATVTETVNAVNNKPATAASRTLSTFTATQPTFTASKTLSTSTASATTPKIDALSATAPVTPAPKLTLKLKPNTGTQVDESVSRRKVVDLDLNKRPSFTGSSAQSFFRPRHSDVQSNMNNRPTFARAPGSYASPIRTDKTDKTGADRFARPKRAMRSTKPSTEGMHRISFSTGLVQDLSDDAVVSNERYRKQRRIGGKVTKTEKIVRDVEVYNGIEIKTLAKTTSANMNTLLYHLRKLGIDMNKQSTLDATTAELLVLDLGHKPIVLADNDPNKDPIADFTGEEVLRAPIVTIVGHVDHGKTSLLDKIRNASVVDKEAGGITQHIGAYQVTDSKDRLITFLDTPGHETFTSMRARGIRLTDIVLLVVASDDGVQAQTVEAIKHIQASGAPMIVVFTKIDKPHTNVKQIKNILMSYGVITTEFGGETIAVEVSAHSGKGIKELLDTINEQAALLDLKARDTGHAVGIAIETKQIKGLGPVINMIVQKGCLQIGDYFTIGTSYGKVKSILDDNGKQIKKAISSQPITLIGVNELCKPGDRLISVPNEKMAKDTSDNRLNAIKTEVKTQKIDLNAFFANKDENKVLKLILRADTYGSIEALENGFKNIDQTNAKIEIVMGLIGTITDSDITLAQTIGATIIAFHTPVPGATKKACLDKGIRLLSEDIIYKIFETLEKLIVDMKEIIYTEIQTGVANIIKVFEFSKGNIAGCKVLSGIIKRGDTIKLMRKDQEIARCTIKTMQKEMQSISEASKNFEVGMVLDNFDKYQVNDQIISFEMKASN